MDLRRYPDLLDRLAGEYVLGTLRGGARRRLRDYAERDPAVRIAIERWQRRFDAMAELVPSVTPSAPVWPAIERRVRAETRSAGVAVIAPRRERDRDRGTAFWRNWAFAASACTAIVLVALLFGPARQLFEPTLPIATKEAATAGAPLRVAVLNDTQGHAAMLVTWNEKQATVTTHLLTGITTPTGKVMELWGLPAKGHPVSLGLLPAGAAGAMPARHAPQAYAQLAISLEPAGGSPNPDAPSGPVLFVGKLLEAS